MKCVIMAGGNGSRIGLPTQFLNKHLLTVYDKPMIYYSISLMMLAGIKDILIIIRPSDHEMYLNVLGDGRRFGINIKYSYQNVAAGIAQGLQIARDFVGDDRFALLLGDNIFYGDHIGHTILEGFKSTKKAYLFSTWNNNPERYGVLKRNERDEPLHIVEKPKSFISNEIITGLYIYDPSVINLVNQQKPSNRGELEISDLNTHLLSTGEVEVNLLGRGVAWFDCGSAKSLFEAASFVKIIQEKQGKIIGSIEEIAFNQKWISREQASNLTLKLKHSEYGQLLQKVISI